MIIVYTYMVGDVLHKGHLQYLKNAKALGDKLVVGILTDEAVMEKKSKPIIGFLERYDIVDALVFVDLAVSQATYSPEHNVSVIRPDILVESDSHKEPFNNPFGRTVVMPYFPIQSSSRIKDRVSKNWKKNMHWTDWRCPHCDKIIYNTDKGKAKEVEEHKKIHLKGDGKDD